MSVELLKGIAMVTMVLDHLGAVGFFGEYSMLMRCVGRLSFPIFAYLMASGFRLTRNKTKHLVMLGVFATLSEVPFDLVHGAIYYPENQNVLWTFFFSSLTMLAIDKAKDIIGYFMAFGLGGLCYFAVYFLNTDYSVYGFSLVLYIFVFENCVCLEKCRSDIQGESDEPPWFQNSDYIQPCVILLANLFMVFLFINYSMVSVPVTFFGVTFSAQLCGVFSFFPIALYILSGQRKKLNGKKAKIFKWFHYCFYPVHLFLLSFLV